MPEENPTVKSGSYPTECARSSSVLFLLEGSLGSQAGNNNNRKGRSSKRVVLVNFTPCDQIAEKTSLRENLFWVRVSEISFHSPCLCGEAEHCGRGSM
jgi:hypothetical protein